jgi:hypothetical protein
MSFPAPDFLLQFGHQLRQPLSTLEASLYHLEITIEGGSRHSLQIRRMRSALDQLSWMVADAMQLWRQDPGTQTGLDFHALLEEALADVKVGTRVALAEEEMTVSLDPRHARHLLGSLLHWCAGIAGEGGELILRTRVGRVGSEFAVEVARTWYSQSEIDAALTLTAPGPLPRAGLALPAARRILEDSGAGLSVTTGDAGTQVLCEFPHFSGKGDR